jgi:cyclopropane fatty-acyl-phospholipid synthase-like methyltransferase
VTPRLDPDGVDFLMREWDAMSEVYAPGNLARWHTVCRRLAAAGLAPGARVLDLGCGPGTLTRRLAEALPTAQVTGADGTAVLIDLARLGRPALPRLRFTQAWLHEVEGTFDVVVSSAMLHYVREDTIDSHLEQLRSLLSHHGRVFHVDTTYRAGDAGAAWSRWWATAAAYGIDAPTWPEQVAGRAVDPDRYARSAARHGFARGEVIPLGGENLLVTLDVT